MGNMLGRRRHAVDEKYTRPQGLYQHRDVDYKKLRKLILNSKLAPCYPGDEECTLDLEECPICFLCYPSLNRSTCCMKAICTECFLRMKQPHSACPTQCPFCKTSNYAVEYRGTRTKEEKGLEEIEEQKVIEAKIRMQQQECQDEEERIQKRQGLCSSSRIVTPGEVECREMPNRSTSVPSFAYAEQGSQFFLPQVPWSLTVNWPPYPRQSRYEDFGPHLEDTMVMETMWHSTQDNGTHRTPASVGYFPSDPSCSQYFYTPHVVAPVEAATSGGLSSAITVLAERQHMCGDITGAVGINDTSLVMLPHSSGLLMREGLVGNYQPEDWIEASPGGGRAVHGGENEWNADPGSEMAEAGTSYTGSNVMFETMAVLPPLDSASMLAGFLLPESFEDQMMMAMAVSVAEARARINTQGLAWL